MALTPCMSCLKQCGYLCGLLAALNIWFWIGMTIFNSMDNKWIKREILLFESYDADTSRYTTVFAICIVVSLSLSKSHTLFSPLAEYHHRNRLLLVHNIKMLSR